MKLNIFADSFRLFKKLFTETNNKFYDIHFILLSLRHKDASKLNKKKNNKFICKF